MPKKRGKGNKQLKPVMHIFCEGEKTEPNYLNSYLRRFHSNNRRLKIIRIEKTKKNTPVQLVREAKKVKNDKNTPANDVFWVVYDRESVHKYSNDLHYQAMNTAKHAEIEVAMSNICFEVWLLLHFNDSTAPYENCDDLIRNSSLKADLRSLGIQSYDKADEELFYKVCDRIPVARSRAEKLISVALSSAAGSTTDGEPYLLNPYTRIHELLDAIDEFFDGKKKLK